MKPSSFLLILSHYFYPSVKLVGSAILILSEKVIFFIENIVSTDIPSSVSITIIITTDVKAPKFV